MNKFSQKLYSVFVVGGKYFACALALLITLYLGASLSLTGANADIADLSYADASGRGTSLGMVNPRYRILNEEENFYTLTAQEAAGHEKSVVDLRDVQADVTFHAEGWTLLQARTGMFEKKRNYLYLNRDVTLYHDSGHELRTHSVDIDFSEQRITGFYPVQGHGPGGLLRGEGLLMTKDKDSIVITGKSRLTLKPARLQR